MEKTDSTTAMASLAAHYTESDKSDDEDESKDVDKISDDEDDQSRTGSIGPITMTIGDDDNNSRSSLTKPNIDQPVDSRKRKATTKLVSYRGDDYDSDRDDASSDVDNLDDDLGVLVKGSLVDYDVALTSEPHDVSSLSRSVLNLSDDEIQVPPEPPGRCAKHLQEKIAKLYERMQRDGHSLSRIIQRKKEVRNPSIYEKLIDFCNIDEKGTNYPPEIYDPHSWDKESFYDALDKVQKTEMEKREKERKERTKVEFVTATKKSEHLLDEKKRKSKWDALPGGAGSGSRSTTTSSTTGSVGGTGSAAANKPTIISAVGNIMKKSK